MKPRHKLNQVSFNTDRPASSASLHVTIDSYRSTCTPDVNGVDATDWFDCFVIIETFDVETVSRCVQRLRWCMRHIVYTKQNTQVFSRVNDYCINIK